MKNKSEKGRMGKAMKTDGSKNGNWIEQVKTDMKKIYEIKDKIVKSEGRAANVKLTKFTNAKFEGTLLDWLHF